jgi:hypothetical protein
MLNYVAFTIWIMLSAFGIGYMWGAGKALGYNDWKNKRKKPQKGGA